MKKHILFFAPIFLFALGFFTLINFFVSCSNSINCAKNNAEDAPDALIVQYANGAPTHCWQAWDWNVNVPNVGSEHLCWRSNGQRVCINDSFIYINPDNGNLKNAAQKLGIELDRCINGRYLALPPKTEISE